MSAIALDDDHDIFVTGGQLSRVSDVDEVVQKITTKLLHYLGEWWLDLNSGVPWFESILGESSDLAEAEAILRRVITSTEGVTTLEEFEADLSPDRVFSVTFEASTAFGGTGEVVVSA